MALVVNLKSADHLPGKADRIVKLTFRGLSYDSNVLPGAKRFAYFGQTFQWPLARGLRADEILTIQLYNHNKYLTNKLVGTCSIFTQQLIQDGELVINDPLVDSNNKMLQTVVSLEVRYYSPDGKVGDWYNRSDFMSPVVNFSANGDTVDGHVAGNSALEDVEDLNIIDENIFNFEGSVPGEDTASQDALVLQQFENTKGRQGMTEAELHTNRDFEVRITIIKGEALAGLDVDPVIRVEVGDQMRYTAIKQSTNAPYYNEYMVFNFNETPATFFDKIITIAAYHAYGIPGRQMLRAGNMVAGKRLIGNFRCDIGTVYSTAGHQFYHKWAVIFDPKDTGAGPKGYIKCDVVICGHGAVSKPPPGVTNDDTDDINTNILLPLGVPLQRQRAVYKITVFRAEDLPRTDLGLLASVQKAVTKKEVAFIDPYIKVSFVGHVGKTSVLKSYNPEWKEVLVFTDMFPPLCNRIKVELCDSEITSDETVAAHFIEMAHIMDPGGDSAEGILPTFGPSWINLYGSPRGFKIGGGDDDEDINQGIGEASAFRGRLLLSIETTIIEGAAAGKATVKREKLLRSSGVMDNFPRRPFLLFGTLFEASLIDKQLENKPIHFELSMGKFGNTLDAKAGYNVFEDSSDDSLDEENDDTDDKQKAALLKKKKEERAVCINHSTTEPRCMLPLDQNYGYMPITPEKTCLFTVGLFEDFRKRLFHSNILTRMYESLDDGLFDVKEMLKIDDPLAHRRLKGTLDIVVQHCDEYTRMFPTLKTGAGAGKTNLDKHRMKACRKFVEDLRALASKVRKTTTALSVQRKYLQIKEAARKLHQLAKDPQHALPDVILWMICDKKRVAYHRFNVRDLIYSTEDLQRGAQCGKRQTVFLKKPGRKVRGEEGWTIQAKLDLYLWLGEYERTKSEKRYLAGLPPGFEEHYEDEAADKSDPPTAIVYENSYLFQLRAYLYQARSLIGSDSSGLSDPFARVMFGSYCKSTQVINETLCPLWDETLIFEDVFIYGVREDLLKNPPTVTVEVFDYDLVGDPEFLGRCIAVPKIKLEEEAYDPAILEWHSIYRGSIAAGELLAGFELLEGASSYLPDKPLTRSVNKKLILFDIPPEIRPRMVKYRLEILFRGVRELKKVQLLAVKQPKIVVECAGQPIPGSSRMIDSTQIKNTEVNSNFDEPVKYLDIYLPEDNTLWPPLTIRCLDCRSFGRTVLVGVGTIACLEGFIFKSEEELESEQLQEAIESPQFNENNTLINIEADVHTTMAAIPATMGSVIIDIPDVIPMQQDVNVQQSPDTLTIDADKIEKVDPASIQGVQGVEADVTVIPKSTGVPSIAASKSRAAPSIGSQAAKPQTLSTKDQAKRERQRLLEEQKEKQLYRELISDCDWWSKYYVTKEDIVKRDKEREEKLKENKDTFIIDDDEDEASDDDYSDYDMIDYSKLNTMKLNQLQQEAKKKAAEMEDEESKKKKKKLRNRQRKKKLRKKLKSMKGAMNRAFTKEEVEQLSEPEEEEAEDKSHISRIQIYNCELEKVPEFGGFEIYFKTYTIYRGKKSLDDEEDEEERLSGYFKGNICIYKLDDEEIDDDNGSKKEAQLKPEEVTDGDSKPHTPELRLSRDLPINRTIEVKVIVYIIRALDLHPVDFNGLADPYLVVRCGRKVINDKENKILNQLNPVFGRICEFEVEFPMDSYLDIEVWDYDSLSPDDIIGSTRIDLENRFFSPHRPRCGLQQKYEMFGYNAWRDPQLPTQILEKLCKDIKIGEPRYGAGYVIVGDKRFTASETVQDEAGDDLQTREHLALEVLKNWEDIPGGCKLVNEHIETRSLFCSERPGEQGRIEMWVDMFPKDQPMPSITLDISPRKPEQYELRCIIWNTDDVALDDVNPLTGERSSDIYVKGYVKGPGEDCQETDVHYRSMTGEGNFNWRFVFPFEYFKAEEKIVFYKKESLFDVGKKEYKVPPVLTLQVWDADIICADDMLGSISMDLNKILRPAKNPKFCTLKMLESKDKSSTINLFKNKRCKGWWPATSIENDEDDGEEEDKLILKGKVEAELQLMTAEEAEKVPVGLGRKEPEPLPLPNRPDTSFTWFINPLKTLYFIIWKNWKWKILKCFIILLLTVLIGLLLYTLPGAITNRILSL